MAATEPEQQSAGTPATSASEASSVPASTTAPSTQEADDQTSERPDDIPFEQAAAEHENPALG